MEINNEIHKRITTVADELFKKSGGNKFPTVDQVRREARSDMNTTSFVMKEWRRKQSAPPTCEAIPEPVKNSMNAALAVVWSEAQALANESLFAAQQIWEAERKNANSVRVELSEAFDAQEKQLNYMADKLNNTNTVIARLERQCENLKTDLKNAKDAAIRDSFAAEKQLLEETGRVNAALARAEKAESGLDRIRVQSQSDMEELKKKHNDDLAAMEASFKKQMEEEKAKSRAQKEITERTKTENKNLRRKLEKQNNEES